MLCGIRPSYTNSMIEAYSCVGGEFFAMHKRQLPMRYPASFHAYDTLHHCSLVCTMPFPHHTSATQALKPFFFDPPFCLYLCIIHAYPSLSHRVCVEPLREKNMHHNTYRVVELCILSESLVSCTAKSSVGPGPHPRHTHDSQAVPTRRRRT